MEANIKILVCAICFVNRKKPGAEIYATFARRLINDVMTKSPYDVRIITNEIEHFTEDQNKWGERVIIVEDKLEKNHLTVGVFNQMLKYKTIQNVPSKYDWLLYLDCDAGFVSELDVNAVEGFINRFQSEGYDMLATRTNAIVKNELNDHETKYKEWEKDKTKWNPGNLFSTKFIFYKVSSENGPFEWMDACMPSEHIFMVKNNEKLPVMAQHFEKFNSIFEEQVSLPQPITWDMEAFEIGVSAHLAGYKVGEMGNDQYNVLKVSCNCNNWEKVKY